MITGKLLETWLLALAIMPGGQGLYGNTVAGIQVDVPGARVKGQRSRGSTAGNERNSGRTDRSISVRRSLPWALKNGQDGDGTGSQIRSF